MIIILHGYDEFLVTAINTRNFIKAIRTLNGDVSCAVSKRGGFLYIEVLNTAITKSIIDYAERYWEADPRRTRIEESGALYSLYEIIDDVDTIGDIAGPNDKLYRKMVEQRIKDRFDFCSSDGFTVKFRAGGE